MKLKKALARPIIASLLGVLGIAAACTTAINVGGNQGNESLLPGAAEGKCGDGLDSDGDGFVDDGCPCTPGETAPCFPGPISSARPGERVLTA